MHSGPPATIAHRNHRLCLHYGQAKPGQTNCVNPVPHEVFARKAPQNSAEPHSTTGSTIPILDFPIAVMEHSPRLG